MSSIPYPLDPMGSTNRGSCFELTVQPGILGDSLTYGFTPSWNAGGYCKVVDWGDGSNEDAVTSGALITHTYAAAGTYTILIKADCYKCMFGYNDTYAPLIYDANGTWDALGNITNGSYMFYKCTNATFPFTSLPDGLTNGERMFSSCINATLPLTSLPDGLTNGAYMFSGCSNAQLPLTSLPAGLTDASGMFDGCINATLPLTSLPSGLTNGAYMFKDCRNATLPLTSLPAGITNASNMFNGCQKATLPLTSLPAGITNAPNMFNGCKQATLPLTSLPAGLTNADYMFYSCINATLPLTSLPDGLTNGIYMFCNCKQAVINLDDLTANAPEGGWTNITSIDSMFQNAGSGNSPGTVTGSRSAFLAKFPNVTNITNAFYGTNTTE